MITYRLWYHLGPQMIHLSLVPQAPQFFPRVSSTSITVGHRLYNRRYSRYSHLRWPSTSSTEFPVLLLFTDRYHRSPYSLRKLSSKMSDNKKENYNVDLFYDAVMKLVKNAGEIIREKNSSRNKLIEMKSGEIDLVTETDQQIEKLLIDGLSSQFPEHKFIGEESVASGSQCSLTNAPTWIIDPIDGTMNFVHSFPHSCISIALFINQKPEIGIVYNPIVNQLFTARKGRGAFLNGQAIKVSGKTSLSDALLMVEFGTSRDSEKSRVVLENQKILMPQVHGLRALGSAALDMAMVACGAADAYFEFGIHIWDIAAGELLVTEAGGVIMDPSGGEIDRLSRRVLVTSSQELAEKIVQNIVQFHPTPRD